MAIDAKTVAELRRRTGLPMMKCKEALAAAGADLALAEENLRKEGFKTIDKLKDREMKEGLVFVAEEKDGHPARVVVIYRQPALDRTIIQVTWDLRDYPSAWEETAPD